MGINGEYSIQSEVSINRSLQTRESPTLEICNVQNCVYSKQTKAHRWTSKGFKEYIVEDVALLCKCLNRFKTSFTLYTVDPVHALLVLKGILISL